MVSDVRRKNCIARGNYGRHSDRLLSSIVNNQWTIDWDSRFLKDFNISTSIVNWSVSYLDATVWQEVRKIFFDFFYNKKKLTHQHSQNVSLLEQFYRYHLTIRCWSIVARWSVLDDYLADDDNSNDFGNNLKTIYCQLPNPLIFRQLFERRTT